MMETMTPERHRTIEAHDVWGIGLLLEAHPSKRPTHLAKRGGVEEAIARSELVRIE
jgi:hypothetical protein